MQAIGYIRFSTKKQEEGSSIERQTETIEKYCQEKGLDLVETLIDDGFSGDGEHMSKGKLGTLIFPSVDSGKYRGFALVVEKMDRFSRQDSDEVVMNQLRLRKGGVELHLAHDGRKATRKDLGEKVQDLVDSETASVFLKNHKINIRRGKESAKDKAATSGWILSRKVPSWLKVVGRENIGNKIVNPGTIVEVPEMVAVVKEMFRLAGLGMSAQHIAEQLNGSALSLSWISRTLADRSVLGEFKPAGRESIAGYFPQIITQTEFDAVRQQAAKKRKNMGGHKNMVGNFRHADRADYLFSGLVHDVTAGFPMTYQGCERGAYLRTSFKAGALHHSLRYDRFEHAFMTFFSEANWKAIAGARESDELRAAKIDLEKVLGEVDKVARRIEATNGLIDTGDLSSSALSAAFERLGKDQATLSTLSDQKDALQVKVDAERAACSALDDSETLLELIKQNSPEATEIRLKLRVEISRRVRRIDITFEDRKPRQAIVRLINGFEDVILFGER